jgi:hypothetical protein
VADFLRQGVDSVVARRKALKAIKVIILRINNNCDMWPQLVDVDELQVDDEDVDEQLLEAERALLNTTHVHQLNVDQRYNCIISR